MSMRVLVTAFCAIANVAPAAVISLDESAAGRRQKVAPDTVVGGLWLCESQVNGTQTDCVGLRSDQVVFTKMGDDVFAELISDIQAPTVENEENPKPPSDEATPMLNLPLNFATVENLIENGVELTKYNPPANQPGYSAGTLNSYEITSDTPEPSTLGLATVAALAMLLYLYRDKKTHSVSFRSYAGY